ncbi:MAG: hypothetical protein E7A31_08270 [Clostridium baratii]|nr:hypothetical protein [Clostridium baratii]
MGTKKRPNNIPKIYEIKVSIDDCIAKEIPSLNTLTPLNSCIAISLDFNLPK